ncbi:MAG: class I SAM-dependent methyltransferase [Candidatus Omnitrophica bacterium]|nr:class I SAM-dependent methyltransferase [Candidatus Omnitrophota bacterium]
MRPGTMSAAPHAAEAGQWYDDWQHPVHAQAFDSRSSLSRTRLIQHYESFNDVRMLNGRLDPSRTMALVEVGCATAEFFRYLSMRHPQVRYYGLDVSETAIARAKAKYPKARVFTCHPHDELATLCTTTLGLAAAPEIVYAKDVMHHQTDPLGFVSRLLRAASEAVILRTRTRDVGATVTDPEQSCQYHYDGWMPYIIVNLYELVEYLQQQAPASEVLVYRHHMVLGGRENRFLPKACYLPATGTAETAIGIFRRTAHPGRVQVVDQRDMPFASPWRQRLKRSLLRLIP